MSADCAIQMAPFWLVKGYSAGVVRNQLIATEEAMRGMLEQWGDSEEEKRRLEWEKAVLEMEKAALHGCQDGSLAQVAH